MPAILACISRFFPSLGTPPRILLTMAEREGFGLWIGTESRQLIESAKSAMTCVGSNCCSISHFFPRSSIFPPCTGLREMSQAFSEWRVYPPEGNPIQLPGNGPQGQDLTAARHTDANVLCHPLRELPSRKMNLNFPEKDSPPLVRKWKHYQRRSDVVCGRGSTSKL